MVGRNNLIDLFVDQNFYLPDTKRFLQFYVEPLMLGLLTSCKYFPKLTIGGKYLEEKKYGQERYLVEKHS